MSGVQKVLRLLSKSLIINPATNSLVLGKGKIQVPAVRVNSTYYVERKRENEALLYEEGQGYLPGILVKSGPRTVFIREEFRDYLQMEVKTDEELNIEIPVENATTDTLYSNIDTMAALLEAEINFKTGIRISVAPKYSAKGDFEYLEVMQYRKGRVRGVYLVNKDKGLVSFFIKLNEDKTAYEVVLDEQCKMVDSVLSV
jgi:hypothetical protein